MHSCMRYKPFANNFKNRTLFEISLNGLKSFSSFFPNRSNEHQILVGNHLKTSKNG